MSFHNQNSLAACQKKYYNKNYFSDKECHKFSDMQKFDAERYARWLNENFEASPYKSFREVAREVSKNYKVSVETISRLARKGDQLLTDNPSRPKIGLVDALSDLFGQPRRDGRLAAGWAAEGAESYEIVPGLLIQTDQSTKLSKTDIEKIVETAKLIANGMTDKE